MNEKKNAVNPKIMENRKEDKKALRIFLVILVCCFVAGLAAGFFSEEFAGGLDEAAAFLIRVLDGVAPFATLVTTTIVLVISLVLERKSRRMYADASWDDEDEETVKQIDTQLNYALILVNMNMILSYFFIGAGFYCIRDADPHKILTEVKFFAVFAGFIYMAVVSLILQKRIVNFTKEMNPEKHGSAYDVSFAKKWIGSCDEAEKLQIYKASYSAYKLTQGACMVLWLICFTGMLTWDFGMLPMTMVLILWATLTIGYMKECFRLSRHPEEIMK